MANTAPQILPIPFGEARRTIPVSLTKGARNNSILDHKELREVLNEMVDKSNQELIDLTAKLHQTKANDPAAYRKLKENHCKGLIIGNYDTRKDEACKVYAPLIGFDIDALESEFITQCLLADCRNCPQIFLAFPSPSGRGLRIFIWCDSSPATHKQHYQAACEMLSEQLRIKTDKEIRKELKAKGKTGKEVNELLKTIEHIDTGTNNLSRIWFYTHLEKEDVYLNEKSSIFKLPSPSEKKKKLKTKRPPSPNATTAISKLLDEKEKIRLCLLMAEKRNIAGGRNNHLYPLACLMYEHGLTEQNIISYCLSLEESDFTESEIMKTVKSAIQRATFQKFTDQQLIYWRAKVEGTKGTSDQQPIPKAAQSIPPTEEGKKESTFIQIKRYLSKKYDFRYNTIANEIEYKEKGETNFRELNENDLICELLELGYNSVEKKMIALLKSSYVPSYNPIQDYFTNLPLWDQETDHIAHLATFIKTKDQDWFNIQFKKMLVRSIACALGRIPFNKQCFTLKGAQNDGKTSFVRFLCPKTLKAYYKEDIDITTKDGRLALCQNMFINFDELDGLSRYELNKIKAMFTVDRVKERLPYDRKPTNLKRRANFFGTTSRQEILTDETGNVRWLIFEVLGILHDNGGAHGYDQNVNIDKVWAQAYHLLKTGFNFKLAPEEIAYSEKKNKGYLVRTAEQELIEEYFEPANKDTADAEFKSATMIMEDLREVAKTTLFLRHIGKALKILGFKQDAKKIKGKGSRKGYWVKKTDSYFDKIAEKN